MRRCVVLQFLLTREANIQTLARSLSSPDSFFYLLPFRPVRFSRDSKSSQRSGVYCTVTRRGTSHFRPLLNRRTRACEMLVNSLFILRDNTLVASSVTPELDKILLRKIGTLAPTSASPSRVLSSAHIFLRKPPRRSFPCPFLVLPPPPSAVPDCDLDAAAGEFCQRA